ncbi:MAG: 50S ribosomal protein L5 [SAR202 cluster bacterium]|nr:50S ribosomal protein L5 [SAR202 cluster bacterium]
MLDEETEKPNDLEETEESEGTVGELSESENSPETEGGEEKTEGGEPEAPRRQRRERAGARAGGGRTSTAALEPPTEPPPTPRLYERFKNEIVPTMVREFSYKSSMEVPRLQKIVLNIGVGEALTNGRAIEAASRDLTTISGQKPIVTKARQSIAGFKVRQGNPIGTAVTLRGARMYHFLDRLVNTALPRIRDFRGLPRRGLDGRGNFSIGIREQIIFPEIDYNDIDKIRGLQVTIATSAKNDTEAIRLLELYGMPFIKDTVEA